MAYVSPADKHGGERYIDFILRARGITTIALGGFLTNCSSNRPFSSVMTSEALASELEGAAVPAS